jgi:serine/threonine-protein kinase
MKNNGDIIEFLKKKEYVMLNNNLGDGSFGKTVLLKDPFIDEVFVAKKYEPDFDDEDEKKNTIRISLTK